MRYSITSLLQNAFQNHKKWPPAWRSPELKSSYDVIIVGGGGHGLAAAYYLAKNHGIKNVAVLEKGWIGGGNTGRNTTNIRSDYLTPEATGFYGFSVELWETLSQELNFNQMWSKRGVVKVAHGRGEYRQLVRRANALHMANLDYEMLTPEQLKKMIPILDTSSRPRFPIIGGVIQRKAGIARHDAVAWGFARAGDSLGVDIIQNCEVLGFKVSNNNIKGVDTTKGFIQSKKVAIVVAGQSTHLADMLGVRLPITTFPLQAWVSEPIKPCLPSMVASMDYQFYVNQSDKGELVIGADRDVYTSFQARGSVRHLKNGLAGMIELFPVFSRLKMLRQWAGNIDDTPDHSPLMTKLPINGVYLNGGWGTGGFKATPGSGFVFADTIANDRPHPLAEPFSLKRFENARLVGEHLAAGGYSS